MKQPINGQDVVKGMFVQLISAALIIWYCWWTGDNDKASSWGRSPSVDESTECPAAPWLGMVDLLSKDVDGAEEDAAIRSGEGNPLKQNLLMHPGTPTNFLDKIPCHMYRSCPNIIEVTHVRENII